MSQHSSDLSSTVFVIHVKSGMGECYDPMKASVAAVCLASPLL